MRLNYAGWVTEKYPSTRHLGKEDWKQVEFFSKYYVYQEQLYSSEYANPDCQIMLGFLL